MHADDCEILVERTQAKVYKEAAVQLGIRRDRVGFSQSHMDAPSVFQIGFHKIFSMTSYGEPSLDDFFSIGDSPYKRASAVRFDASHPGPDTTVMDLDMAASGIIPPLRRERATTALAIGAEISVGSEEELILDMTPISLSSKMRTR